MKYVHLFIILFFSVVMLSSCEEDPDYQTNMPGLWKQTEITEDGVPMNLTPEQKACKLLIEPNGVYRCYHRSFISYNNGNGPTSFYGTWSVLDDRWVNFTTDKWQLTASVSTDSAKVVFAYKDTIVEGKTVKVFDMIGTVQRQWSKFHLQSRFTIIKLTATEMEIRLKTFVGEKKYALLFAPDPSDFLGFKVDAGKWNYTPKLVTDQNYWTIQKEFRTLKTYVFKFEKETN